MNNLLKRTITSVVFAAVMVCGIGFNPIICGALMLTIGLVAMKEFFTITIGSSMKLQQRISIALMFLLLVFNLEFCGGKIYLNDYMIGVSLIVLTPVAILSSAIFSRDHADFRQIAYVLAGLVYIGIPVALSPFAMFDGDYQGWQFLSLFVIIWGSDVGAYCLGSTLGQRPGAHKMAPAISPKKSWWGFAGAVILGVAVAVVLSLTGLLEVKMIHAVILGVIISVGAVAGDLVESLWKRAFGVKDSGNCIPGHGGMLDRFDSSLVAIPLAAIYLSFID